MNPNISYPPFFPTLSCLPHPQVTGDLPSIITEYLHFPELFERNYTICTCECVCACVISFTQYTISRFIILQCVSIASCSKDLYVSFQIISSVQVTDLFFCNIQSALNPTSVFFHLTHYSFCLQFNFKLLNIFYVCLFVMFCPSPCQF